MVEEENGAGEQPTTRPGPDAPALATKRPLRIAMVVPPYFEVPPRAYGGVESVVADLADALVERGHDVTLIGAGEPGTRARFVPLWPRPSPNGSVNRSPRSCTRP